MAETNTRTENQKRTDYIKWKDYFMGIALLSGQRSKDRDTLVGACIITKKKELWESDIMGCRMDAAMMSFRGIMTKV